MNTPTPSGQRARLLTLFAVVAITLTMLAPALDIAAQSIRTTPTETPTEEFDPGFAAQPTEEPTREPERTPPTEAPAATDEPEPAAPSSLTLNKGACDDTAFDPYTATGLDAFLDACSSPDGEFEFTVSNNVAFNTTQSTGLGTLFMQVPTGPITITETIPAGWGDPAVFCWSNLLPTPSDTPYIGNSPTWNVAEGEDVECWWFNVSEQPAQLHTIRATSLACPEGTDLASDYWTLATACVDPLSGIDFQVFSESGTFGGPTDASGGIEWTDVDLGASGGIQIIEDVPEGYGEPVVWCVSFPVEAADAQDFDFFAAESVDGTVTVEPERHAPFIFSCAFYHGASGDDSGNLLDPAQQQGGEEVEHQITLTKRTCPAGTDPDAGLAALLGACPIAPGVEFTLTYGGGATSTTETDASGVVSWDGIPYGEFEILETNHANYALQSTHCQFEDLPGPGAWRYDFTNGIYDGSFDENLDPEGGPIHLTCDWFNFEDGEGVEVLVIKHRCPLGVPEDLTVAEYLELCTALFEGIDFTLDHAGGSFPGTTGEDGQVEWSGVPAGEVEVQESIPEGYKDPIAFCISFEGEQELASNEAVATSGLIEIDIPVEATDTVCWVINIPDPELATSLTVNKWRCPIGFDEEAGDPASECTEPMDGITFHLGGMEAMTGEGAPGQAVFLDVPIGEQTLTEDPPAGIDHAFIRDCAVNGESVVLLVPINAFPALGLLIEAGDHWTCEWYNVPAVESRVVVNKRICADDVDLVLTDDNEINDIITACPSEGDGIESTLDHAGGSSTQEIVDGATYWDGVPNGPITITETVPAGYLEPVWYCDSNAFDEDGILTGNLDWQPVNAPGGVLDESLDEPYGEIFACWVFNVPGDDGLNLIWIEKYACPDDLSQLSNNLDDYLDACGNTPNSGIDFVLEDSTGAVTAHDTDDNGYVEFAPVPLGPFSIQEEVPDGNSYPVVFCNFADVIQGLGFQDGPAERVDSVGGLVDSLIEDPNVTYFCYFFNFHKDTTNIVIHKWLCPEGFDPNSSDIEYSDTCTEALDDITFKAMSDLGIAVLDTVDGTVEFGGFSGGMVVGIQEEIPGEYGNPYVICRRDNSDWEDVGAQSGYFDLYIEDGGHTIVCHVFNFQGEDGSITVLKWTCPPGYDLHAWGADPSADCTEATNGVTFELRIEGNPALVANQVTGDVIEGGVVFDDLEPDIYNIAELMPDGIASAFILECTGHIMGQLQPYPLQYGPFLDDIDLDAGEHLVCHWFNVPEEDGGGLTLFKYTCATEEFVSEVECQIEEDGVTFDLLVYNEGTAGWDLVDTRETDGFGRIEWVDLNSGEYRVEEHGATWCHLVVLPEEDSAGVARVLEGTSFEMHVYNCDGTPGEPGDTPTKYPDTGVPPADATPASSPRRRSRRPGSP